MRWRRLDRRGEDVCHLRGHGSGFLLSGVATLIGGRDPARLRYKVLCDGAFGMRKAVVNALIRGRRRHVVVEARNGRWLLNGRPRPSVEGCIDIDLAFTPATNLLPLRRLRPVLGRTYQVDAAWLTFPGLTLRRLRQTYRRVGQGTYDYRSGRFRATLRVNRRGFVERYGDLWAAVEARPRSGSSPQRRQLKT